MEREKLRGACGYVKFEGGLAIKIPHDDRCPSVNREYIAYKRMKPRVKDLSVALLRSVEVLCHKERRLNFVVKLTFDDAGTDLRSWFLSQWLFNPIYVLPPPFDSEVP